MLKRAIDIWVTTVSRAKVTAPVPINSSSSLLSMSSFVYNKDPLEGKTPKSKPSMFGKQTSFLDKVYCISILFCSGNLDP